MKIIYFISTDSMLIARYFRFRYSMRLEENASIPLVDDERKNNV